MSGKYWLNWQQASTSWFRITDHALRFLCFHSEFWIAFCCRKPLNHLAHTELQATQASAWVRNALTLIQDRYGSCRLPLFFSMPKLILHAVLAQEVTDKQCLHVVQSSLTRGHGQWLAPLSDPAQTSSRYRGVGGDGDDHYKTICQEGCNALFDRAVDSPACRLPVDTCSSTRPVQSHQPQKCPQPTKQRVKQATGWSCRWRAQLGNPHTKTKKSCRRVSRGGLFASHQKEHECLWKPNEARNCFCMPRSDLHWQPLFLKLGTNWWNKSFP